MSLWLAGLDNTQNYELFLVRCSILLRLVRHETLEDASELLSLSFLYDHALSTSRITNYINWTDLIVRNLVYIVDGIPLVASLVSVSISSSLGELALTPHVSRIVTNGFSSTAKN